LVPAAPAKASELESAMWIMHELAEAHLLRSRFEIVALGGHGFSHRQSKVFADLPVLGEDSFVIVLGGAREVQRLCQPEMTELVNPSVSLSSDAP